MNTTTQPVAHEEILPEVMMAWLDGELPSAEAATVAAHVRECAECASVAAQIRATSQMLSSWTVPTVPAQLEDSVAELALEKASGQTFAKQKLFIGPIFWTWKQWAFATACAVYMLLIAFPIFLLRPPRQLGSSKPVRGAYLTPQAGKTSGIPQPNLDDRSSTTYGYSGKIDPNASIAPDAQADFADEKGAAHAAPPPPPPATLAKENSSGFASVAATDAHSARYVGASNQGSGVPPSVAPAPMIARSVSLILTVKDFAAARASLDSILARHHGYAAQLTASTAENQPRSLQAALRVPAPELSSALAEIRALGRVQTESQSGEEVTQQHTDLVARLKNSRETEARLQAILRQRTGKISDTLEVEQEIERVRGEIEGMEADQKTLEHRVDFSSLNLQINEEYKAQFNAPDKSASTRMHNAIIAGLDNASAAVLGLVLFFEEYGPVILIWLAIFGLPVFFVWRRYRKVRGQL